MIAVKLKTTAEKLSNIAEKLIFLRYEKLVGTPCKLLNSM